jgi:hypothetical protein
MVFAQEILEILSKIFRAKEFPTNFDTLICGYKKTLN